MVAVDGDRLYLVQEGSCSCGSPDCPHIHLALPEFLHRYQRRPATLDPCPDCGGPLQLYRNDRASITLCPLCGHGVRRRTSGAKTSLHNRRGRRARTAKRFL